MNNEFFFEIRDKYIIYLSLKYTAYMSYASDHELMILAALKESKHTIYSKEQAIKYAKELYNPPQLKLPFGIKYKKIKIKKLNIKRKIKSD